MQDIRDAIRALLGAPAVTMTAILLLALGVGATSAIFAVANGVLFRPLPFASPDRLVQLGAVGILDFQTYRQQSAAFESLVSYSGASRNLDDAAGAERVATVVAEPALFELLGVRPLTGRVFTESDRAPVAVVSERFWRRRGAAASVEPWTLTLDREAYTVVGIMPASFQFPYGATLTDVWILNRLPTTVSRFQRVDAAIGRLKPGATIDAARAPSAIVPLTPLRDAIAGRSTRDVLILLGAAGLLLMIACANVANLLLVRGESRRREVAIRVALGAGRGRLLRQFLTESIIFAVASSAAALLIAVIGTRVLSTLVAGQLPRGLEIGIDATVFAFLLTIGLVTGMTVGIIPALRALRANVSSLLGAHGARHSMGRRSSAVTHGLIVTEVAIAFVLVVGAGLLLRAFLSLQHVPIGVRDRGVLTLRLETRGLLPPDTGPNQAAMGSNQGRYFQAVEDRVRQIGGVRAAGFVTRLHIQSPGNLGQLTLAPQAAPSQETLPVRLREASPGYFEALGIPLVRGRMFTARDAGLLVNEAFVRAYLAGADPIGREVSRGTIIGVVGDVRQNLRRPAEPEIFMPLAATSYSAATLVVSADRSPEALVGPVRLAVRDINPRQAVFDVQGMDAVVAAAYGDVSVVMRLVALFAALALILSAAGIYAVISFAVAARGKEFAIRLALGADRSRLVRSTLARGGRFAGAGIVVGAAGALLAARALQNLLYEVTPSDPLTFVVTAAVFAGVSIVACIAPARAAAAANPAALLRQD